MPRPEFFKKYFISLGLAIILTILMLIWPPLSPYLDFAVISFLFFAFLAWGVYELGVRSIAGSNKMYFSYLSLGVVFVKMLAAIALIAAYQFMIQPANKFYIVIFAVHYIVFTVLEVQVLMRLAKSK
jgi:hypothetical protein